MFLCDDQRAFLGAYTASRAAALAGVPKSTVYYWARTGLIVPSVSPVKERLWSYADLIAIRMVSWLRREKRHESARIPSTPMSSVRRAFAQLKEEGLDIWSDTEDAATKLLVDLDGIIHIRRVDVTAELSGQVPMPFVDLIAPFSCEHAHEGPDLVRPRSDLRIVPGKVAGQPHIVRTRITSLAVRALWVAGYTMGQVCSLYPEQARASLEQAISLEDQLASEDVA